MNSKMKQHQRSNLETFSIKSWNRTLQWRHIWQLALHDTPTVITDAPAVAHVADDQNLLLLVEPRSGGRSCLTHPSTPKSWIFTFQPLRSVHKPSVSSSFSSCTCCLAVMVASLVFGSRKSHWVQRYSGSRVVSIRLSVASSTDLQLSRWRHLGDRLLTIQLKKQAAP